MLHLKMECMIIAVTNLKGGVGKSTLSVHLAVWLSERGRKVVLVDADAQGAVGGFDHVRNTRLCCVSCRIAAMSAGSASSCVMPRSPIT